MKGKLLLVLAFGLCVVASVSAQETVESRMEKIKKFKAAGKYSQALTELTFVQDELSKEYLKKLETFFPAKAKDFTAEPIQSEGILGVMSLERIYKNSSGVSVRLSLVGGVSDSSGVGQGLGEMAQAAVVIGQIPGAEQVLIKGKQGTLIKDDAGSTITFSFGGNTVLQVEPEEGEATAEQLKAVAEAVDMEGLGKYLEEK